MVKRPPDCAVGYVCEKRCHISSVEPTEPVSCKYLSYNVSCLSKSDSVLCSGRRLWFDFKACQMLPFTLHHELLRDHVNRDCYTLGNKRCRPSCHQGLYSVVLGVIGDVLPYQLIRRDIRLPRYEREGVHHEAPVKSSNPLGSQDFPEGIVGAAIERLSLLNLQSGADEHGRVDRSTDGHGHKDTERVELALVQVLPFYDLDVPLLLHGFCLKRLATASGLSTYEKSHFLVYCMS